MAERSKGIGVAAGTAIGAAAAALALVLGLSVSNRTSTRAVAPEATQTPAPDASAFRAAGFDDDNHAPAAQPVTPGAPPDSATAISPDGSSVNFSDDSLSFSAAIPTGPADDPVLAYLRQDSARYLAKFKTNARTAADDAKREGHSFIPWEVDIEWKYTAKAGDLVSLAGSSSEYTGGAHPMTFFDAHIANAKTGAQLKFADMLQQQGSPAITIAVCEALKAAKQARIGSLTIMEEPIVCAGGSANIKADQAKIALAPSNQPDRFGGLYVYYEAYAVGPYSEGSYNLTIQQEVFAQDLKAEFKPLFGGKAPLLEN
ncbi:MAG: DUF4163 domain-containing protein [Hyphomonadaceae bacterium]